MMEILKQAQKLKELTMSTKDKQRNINVSEVFHLWTHLVQRYNIIYTTCIFESFAKDDDLKLILLMGKKTLAKHITILEKEMTQYAIPLPIRPPKQTQTTISIEQINDRYIFRRILRGIQGFLPTHTMAFVHSTSPKIRELFMTFLIEEMKLYDKLMEYGKIKGYEIMPPVYSA
jgi:spore coat protein CotF